MVREILINRSKLVSKQWVVDRSAPSTGLENVNLRSLKNCRKVGLLRSFRRFGPVPVPAKRVYDYFELKMSDIEVNVSTHGKRRQSAAFFHWRRTLDDSPPKLFAIALASFHNACCIGTLSNSNHGSIDHSPQGEEGQHGARGERGGLWVQTR